MSVGELAMTPKISLVAVCCSSDSLSSWNSRTFSMAITAWSAKVLRSAICLSVKGCDFCAPNYNSSDRDMLTKQRCGKYGPSRLLAFLESWPPEEYSSTCAWQIGYVDRLTVNDRSGSRYRPDQGSLLSDRNKRAV